MSRLWLFGLVLAGCGAPNHLRAVVKTAACEGPGAQPVAGAAVSLQCPDEKPRLIGTTDARGRFAYERVGPMRGECSVQIDKQGFASRSYEIGDVCIMHGRGPCAAVSITADLVAKP